MPRAHCCSLGLPSAAAAGLGCLGPALEPAWSPGAAPTGGWLPRLGPSELRHGSSQRATLLLAQVSTGAPGWCPGRVGHARGHGRGRLERRVYPSTSLASSQGEAAVLLVSERAEALRQGTGIYILKLATYKTTKAAEANQHVDICLIEK